VEGNDTQVESSGGIFDGSCIHVPSIISEDEIGETTKAPLTPIASKTTQVPSISITAPEETDERGYGPETQWLLAQLAPSTTIAKPEDTTQETMTTQDPSNAAEPDYKIQTPLATTTELVGSNKSQEPLTEDEKIMGKDIEIMSVATEPARKPSTITTEPDKTSQTTSVTVNKPDRTISNRVPSYIATIGKMDVVSMVSIQDEDKINDNWSSTQEESDEITKTENKKKKRTKKKTQDETNNGFVTTTDTSSEEETTQDQTNKHESSLNTQRLHNLLKEAKTKYPAKLTEKLLKKSRKSLENPHKILGHKYRKTSTSSTPVARPLNTRCRESNRRTILKERKLPKQETELQLNTSPPVGAKTNVGDEYTTTSIISTQEDDALTREPTSNISVSEEVEEEGGKHKSDHASTKTRGQKQEEEETGIASHYSMTKRRIRIPRKRGEQNYLMTQYACSCGSVLASNEIIKARAQLKAHIIQEHNSSRTDTYLLLEGKTLKIQKNATRRGRSKWIELDNNEELITSCNGLEREEANNEEEDDLSKEPAASAAPVEEVEEKRCKQTSDQVAMMIDAQEEEDEEEVCKELEREETNNDNQEGKVAKEAAEDVHGVHIKTTSKAATEAPPSGDEAADEEN
jgi:hypothetical protein